MNLLSTPNPAQYTDLFVSEAQDHLQEMNQALLVLEEACRAGARGGESGEIASLFRAAHTLKGMAAALGFEQIARLAHRMEDGLDLLRQKQRSMTLPLADALFACLDRLGRLVEVVAASGSEAGEVSRELALLDSVLQNVPESAPVEPQPAPPPAARPAWEVCLQIAPTCQLKGPRAFVILRRLSSLAPLLECRPPEAELRAGSYADGFSLFFGAGADPQALSQAAGWLSEVAGVDVIALQSPESQVEQQPVVEDLKPSAVVAGVPPVQPSPAGPIPPPAMPAPSPAKVEALAGEPAAPASLVRLKVSLLDQLLEAVADMVVNHSLLMQISRKHDLPDLKEGLETHAVAIKRLEQVVLDMRMVPVAQVFNRFPRLVRDLALELGKQVHFEMEGAEIELDRMILDRLADPLVHLLRNALDHGIEPPAERTRAGKPLPALVRLAAHRQQNKVLIEVSDDGRGLSADAILKVALDRGVLTPRQAAGLDQRTIFELICLPGFSTRAQASGISGRGVGMDVVKQTLNEMGGGLEIEAQPGQGSLFRLTCPLTMAILPAIMVRSGAESYAIPLTHIVHTLEVQAADLRWLYSQPVLPWNDSLLPLLPLGRFLGQAEALAEAGKKTGQPIQVVVVAPGRQAYGLVVDEILGKEDIVLKPLAKYLGSIAGLSGITLRGEGEIALVLDVAGLVQTLAVSGKGGGDE